MAKAVVELEDMDLRAVRALAEQDHRSIDDVITLAVRNYVAHRAQTDESWRRRWMTIIAELRQHVPPSMSEAEIEAEIRVAREEYRNEKHARGS